MHMNQSENFIMLLIVANDLVKKDSIAGSRLDIEIYMLVVVRSYLIKGIALGCSRRELLCQRGLCLLNEGSYIGIEICILFLL